MIIGDTAYWDAHYQKTGQRSRCWTWSRCFRSELHQGRRRGPALARAVATSRTRRHAPSYRLLPVARFDSRARDFSALGARQTKKNGGRAVSTTVATTRGSRCRTPESRAARPAHVGLGISQKREGPESPSVGRPKGPKSVPKRAPKALKSWGTSCPLWSTRVFI